jgi:protein-tyrosine phosphatase
MSHSTIYWIDGVSSGRLAIMARPRAGDWLDDEIANWAVEGVRAVVRLLERDEIEDLDLGGEATACLSHGIELIDFPIPDRGVPSSRNDTIALARVLAGRLSRGQGVAVHCRAGIGRSSLIAACTMRCLGMNVAKAFDLITKARGLPVPDTEDQRRWAVSFGEAFD